MINKLQRLRYLYQKLHDSKGLGGKVEIQRDGDGLYGFYNPVMQIWQWWKKTPDGYEMISQTEFAT